MVPKICFSHNYHFSFNFNHINMVPFFGSTVKVLDLENNKKISYRLVGQDEADLKKNLIFFKSPIGKALISKEKGEIVSVNTPSGERNFEILEVEYI